MKVADLNESIQRFWKLWLEDRRDGLDTPNYKLYQRIHPDAAFSTAVSEASVYWSKIKQCVEHAAYFEIIGLGEESLDKRLMDLLNAEEVERVVLPDGGFDYKRRGKNLRSQEASIRLAMQRTQRLREEIHLSTGEDTENMSITELARLAARKRKEAQEQAEHDSANTGTATPDVSE